MTERLPTLQPGLTDPEEARNYVDGECHFFALAIHKLTGLFPGYVADCSRDGTPIIGHVVVMLPDGTVADAEGVWRPDDLLAHWEATDIIPTSPEDIEVHLADSEESLSDYCRERISRAERLLQEEERAFFDRLRDVPGVEAQQTERRAYGP